MNPIDIVALIWRGGGVGGLPTVSSRCETSPPVLLSAALRSLRRHLAAAATWFKPRPGGSRSGPRGAAGFPRGTGSGCRAEGRAVPPCVPLSTRRNPSSERWSRLDPEERRHDSWVRSVCSLISVGGGVPVGRGVYSPGGSVVALSGPLPVHQRLIYVY